MRVPPLSLTLFLALPSILAQSGHQGSPVLSLMSAVKSTKWGSGYAILRARREENSSTLQGCGSLLLASSEKPPASKDHSWRQEILQFIAKSLSNKSVYSSAYFCMPHAPMHWTDVQDWRQATLVSKVDNTCHSKWNVCWKASRATVRPCIWIAMRL